MVPAALDLGAKSQKQGARENGTRLFDRSSFFGSITGLFHQVANGDEAYGQDDEPVDGINVGKHVGLLHHDVVGLSHGAACGPSDGVAPAVHRALESMIEGAVVG